MKAINLITIFLLISLNIYSQNKKCPSPTITDIIPQTECLFSGDTMYFSAVTSEAENYLWTFGNADTSTNEIAAFVFQDEGYYYITLETSNACGSANYSEVFYILPDNCACDSVYGGNYAFTYYDGDTISTFTEWNPTTYSSLEVYVEGDLYIEPGAELRVNDITVYFGPKGRIIVDRGALLMVWHSKLTGLPTCNNMWQGIEVWGSPNFSLSSDNGELFFDSVLIENAHIAILVGKRNMDYLINNNLEKFDLAYSGGQIRVNNSEFFNNGIGIKGTRRTIGGINQSKGEIRNSNFHSETLLDINYNNLTGINPFPNSQNPWAAYANKYQRTAYGIWIDDFKSGNIWKNDFRNMQYCIQSFDSKYDVSECVFRYANFGIKINNTISTVDFRHEISLCSFDSIPGETTTFASVIPNSAIYINGGRYDYIHDNIFGLGLTEQDVNNTGIFTINASGFNISENKFEQFKYAIQTGNTANNGGYIGAWSSQVKPVSDWWQGNIYTKCWRSITSFSDNLHLRLKCNKCYNDNINPSNYDVNFKNYGLLANQGSPTQQGIPFSPVRFKAGNEFNPFDWNEPEWRLIESDNSTYIYYRHTSPPEVIPVNFDGNININATNSVPKTSSQVACPPAYVTLPAGPSLPTLSGGTFKSLDSLSLIKDSLQLVYDDIVANLDGGETEYLLNRLNSNVPRIFLTGELIQHSPLSDTVLISAITREPRFRPIMFTLIMINNLPVSKNVEPYYYARIKTMPYIFRNWLLELQAYNPYGNSPGKLEQEMNLSEMNFKLFQNHLIMMLNDTINDRKQDAVTLLENEQSIESERTLIATYIADSNYVDALAKLAAIPTDNSYINDWVQLNQILLDLYMQGKTIFELDSIDLEFIRNLAYKCPAGLATSNSQAILELLFNEQVPVCPIEMTTRNLTFSFKENNSENYYDDDENEVLGENYPDPAGNYTKIPYLLPDGVKGIIQIFDINGKLLKTYNANSGEHIINVDTKDWKTGVYTYSLLIEGLPLITKKMIIGK